MEYYHRIVVGQWVGVTPAAILDLELIAPHEGEVAAARRIPFHCDAAAAVGKIPVSFHGLGVATLKARPAASWEGPR